MLKNILILVFTIFFLASCGSSEKAEINTTGLIKTETDLLSIDLPANWKVIEDVENILPKAKEGNIELAVASENMVNGFVNNLLILSTDIKTFTTSKEFSMLNNIWAESEYIDYTKIESKEFIFTDSEKSMLYIFEAKYNYDTPKLKFLQTAYICNQNKALFFTLAIPTTVRDTSKYEYFLSTATCK